MAYQPQFAATPRQVMAQILVANPARDGSGTAVAVFSSGPAGSRIERIRIQAVGPTTSGVVRIFLSDGASIHLYRELLVEAITPSVTTAAFTADIDSAGLLLQPGQSLLAATHNAEVFNLFIEGGDF